MVIDWPKIFRLEPSWNDRSVEALDQGLSDLIRPKMIASKRRSLWEINRIILVSDQRILKVAKNDLLYDIKMLWSIFRDILYDPCYIVPIGNSKVSKFLFLLWRNPPRDIYQSFDTSKIRRSHNGQLVS